MKSLKKIIFRPESVKGIGTGPGTFEPTAIGKGV